MEERQQRRRRPVAAVVSIISILAVVAFAVWMLSGGRLPSSELTMHTPQLPVSSVLPEVEATEFGGVKLVPISQQGNNAICGTRHTNRGSYRLQIGGLVNNELSKSYDDLLRLPAVSEAVYMPCVEGWGFMAKWTGFKVADLLDQAGVKPDGSFVMFYSDDGYSTGLPLSYIRDNDIILAYGLNDLTLPDDRGFPFQLVAKSKYGYKWAKWITKIEVLNAPVLGYWESRGYSNEGDVR